MKLLTFLVSLFFLGCAGSKPEDQAKELEEKLISFSMFIQAKNYDYALELVSLDDQGVLMNSSGEVKQELQTGFKRLKISTLKKYPLHLNEDGRIVGIADVVAKTAKRFQISDSQRNLDLSKITKDVPKSSILASSSTTLVTDSTETPTEEAVDEDGFGAPISSSSSIEEPEGFE